MSTPHDHSITLTKLQDEAVASHQALSGSLYEFHALTCLELRHRMQIIARWLTKLAWTAYPTRLFLAVSLVEESARKTIVSLEAIYRRHRISEVLLIQARSIRVQTTREESAAMRKLAVVEFTERESVYRQALTGSSCEILDLLSTTCTTRVATIRRAKAERPGLFSQFYGGIVLESAYENVLKPELLSREAIIRYHHLLYCMQNIEQQGLFFAFFYQSEVIRRQTDIHAVEARWRSWLEFAEQERRRLSPYMPWYLKLYLRCGSLLEREKKQSGGRFGSPSPSNNNISPTSSPKRKERSRKRREVDVCDFTRKFFARCLLPPLKETCLRELVRPEENEYEFSLLNTISSAGRHNNKHILNSPNDNTLQGYLSLGTLGAASLPMKNSRSPLRGGGAGGNGGNGNGRQLSSSFAGSISTTSTHRNSRQHNHHHHHRPGHGRGSPSCSPNGLSLTGGYQQQQHNGGGGGGRSSAPITAVNTNTSLFPHSCAAKRFRQEILSQRPKARQPSLADRVSHLSTHETFRRHQLSDGALWRSCCDVILPSALETNHACLLAAHTPFDKIATYFETYGLTLDVFVHSLCSEESRNYRRRVRLLYRMYVPEMSSLLHVSLAKFMGREEELIDTLVKKFGPEPTTTTAEQDGDEQDSGDAFLATFFEPHAMIDSHKLLTQLDDFSMKRF